MARAAAFYAVQRGRRPGVYPSWDACQAEVTGFPRAAFKKFPTRHEAECFVNGADPSSSAAKASSFSSSSRGGSSSSSQQPYASASAGPSSSQQQPGKLQKLERGAVERAIEGEDGFCRTRDGRLVVYTDGGCTSNGKKNSRAGLGVYWGARSGRNLSEPVPGPVQTNNRGELLAILRALETAPEPTGPLEIRTDSKYCIDCMVTWLPGWRRKNFKSSTGSDVLNLDLILHIERLLIARAAGAPAVEAIALRNVLVEPAVGDVLFRWIKGHGGEEGNEMADRLATAGCTKPQPLTVPQYAAEELLYLHGRRAGAAAKRAGAPAPAAPSTSSYFAPAAQQASAAVSATAAGKRKRASAAAAALVLDRASDDADDEVQVIEPPPPAKKPRERPPAPAPQEDEFDALDASWLLDVGLDGPALPTGGKP